MTLIFDPTDHELSTAAVVAEEDAPTWVCEACNETDEEFRYFELHTQDGGVTFTEVGTEFCEECYHDHANTKEEEMRWLEINEPDRWWAMQPMTEHQCEGCGCTFKGQTVRGPLAYCDGCADKIEMGVDIHA